MSGLAGNPLLRPASIALIGASPRQGRPSLALQHLRRLGFAGPVYPVNPGYGEVYGLPCYPSLAALPAPADCAIISVAAASVPGIVRDCVPNGTRAAVVLSAG